MIYIFLQQHNLHLLQPNLGHPQKANQLQKLNEDEINRHEEFNAAIEESFQELQVSAIIFFSNHFFLIWWIIQVGLQFLMVLLKRLFTVLTLKPIWVKNNSWGWGTWLLEIFQVLKQRIYVFISFIKAFLWNDSNVQSPNLVPPNLSLWHCFVISLNLLDS